MGERSQALAKELRKSRAMTTILASQASEARAQGEALIRMADKLLCESWNEKMWADGGPIDRRRPWTKPSTAGRRTDSSGVKAR